MTSDARPRLSRLPDTAIVVRAGIMQYVHTMESILEHFDLEGEYGLSVLSYPELSTEELATLAGLRHIRVRVATVAALREAGYDVRHDPNESDVHALVVFRDEPTDIDYEALDGVFGDPIPNPGVPR